MEKIYLVTTITEQDGEFACIEVEPFKNYIKAKAYFDKLMINFINKISDYEKLYNCINSNEFFSMVVDDTHIEVLLDEKELRR